MSTLRIYVAITTFFPLIGGAETQTHAQCKLLHEKGIDATIVTFRHEKDWARYEVIGGVPVMRIAGLLLSRRKMLPRLLQRLLYALAMLQMSLTIWHQRKRFDVLQVCQFNLLVLPLAIVCRIAHKPMIIVVISAGTGKQTKSRNKATLIAGPIDPTATWLEVDGQTWIDGDLYGLERAGKPVLGFMRSQLKHIQVAVVVLSSRMNMYLAGHDLRLSDTQIIPNGVDIQRFCPPNGTSALEEDSRSQTVICVSKLRFEKGIDVLLHAWRLVHAHIPTARLIIVGSGPIQFQLERLANTLCIAGSVEFAGLQSDVPSQLHRGKIGVLPSRWEGMPNALLESMACGLACVATAVSGSEDIIQHGCNGFLVEPEDYESMAEALLTLLHNPELTQKFGIAARRTIEKNYSLEHITNIYIELYQRLTHQQVVDDEQLSESRQLIS
ncbi:MAG: glycosyltransferase family 4 protein [Ktedonobacteraceae bacterium]